MQEEQSRLARNWKLFGMIIVALVVLGHVYPLAAGNDDAAISSQYLPLMRKDSYVMSFDGAPDSPTQWSDPTWDISVTSRDRNTWFELEPVNAHHGPHCEPPPQTHTISRYEDVVFQCANHVMTALYAGGYAAAYLTPNQMVDFSDGEAVIQVDVSTLRTSNRDWWSIWITPYEDNLVIPLEGWLPAQSGVPRRAIQIRMTDFNSQTTFAAKTYQDHIEQTVDGNPWQGYEEFLTPDARRRDTFELRISKNHIKFGMPAYGFWWVDSQIEELDWSQGVVTLSHHSYNPGKCANCTANTWHWDNLMISRVAPFTIIQSDQRFANEQQPTLGLRSPAPAGSHLRFTGIGGTLEVSYDGGQTWQTALLQAQDNMVADHFRSYWMPIPEGTTSVTFRGERWWDNDWHVRNVSVWSLEAPE